MWTITLKWPSQAWAQLVWICFPELELLKISSSQVRRRQAQLKLNLVYLFVNSSLKIQYSTQLDSIIIRIGEAVLSNCRNRDAQCVYCLGTFKWQQRLRWKIELGRIYYCSTYFLTLHGGVDPLLWPYTISKKKRIAYHFPPPDILLSFLYIYNLVWLSLLKFFEVACAFFFQYFLGNSS